MDEDLEDNLTRPGTWIRGLFMLLFGVIFELSSFLSYAVAALQFLISLFTGRPNRRLQAFGGDLSAYVGQIVGFLTYVQEDRPFPFSDWPGGRTAAKKSTAKRKTAGKKSAGKP